MTKVRTRFAPSPTGFIHLGNIRSALYPWAYARANQGEFILRIEDTDVERSTQQAVDVILQSMQWLGMQPDQGPFYQMQRIQRYKQVLQQMLEQGTAYYCYMSEQQLNALREQQAKNNQPQRYDGTWRPEPGKELPTIPADVKPVIRFKNPTTGQVCWDDKVKGQISISNSELDDIVIARPDGTPTYNFCVVVDDIDMQISHVIRGDDHVNNTPKQINIFQALGVQPPVYAHLPTVLNANGDKMSKRHGAKPVIQYKDEGYLASALINYLARLGWSHGDEEIFSVEQFLQWFNLDSLGRSASQFDEAKLKWVNAQHIKLTDNDQLAELISPLLQRQNITVDERLSQICGLFKDRCDTLLILADWAKTYYSAVQYNPADAQKYLSAEIAPAINLLADKLAQLEQWSAEHIAQVIKDCVQQTGLKMPQIAMPARVLVFGVAQTPSVDLVLALQQQGEVVTRLRKINQYC